MKPVYLCAVLPVLLAACADSGAICKPIRDGLQDAAFQSDLSACQRLARNQRQFEQETAGAALLGAGTGALLGAADPDGVAVDGAIVGALAGGVAGTVNASERRETIVNECLRGRG